MKSLYALLTLCSLQTACSFAPVGQSNFDCNRQENANSPYCRSFKAVLNGANPPLAPTRFDLRANQQEYEKMAGIAPTGEQVEQPAPRRSSAIAQTRPQLLPHFGASQEDSHGNAKRTVEGSPVRQAPVLQRAWIKRHVEGDTLVDDTEVTWEIAPSKWLGIPAVATSQDSRFGGQVVPYRVNKTTTISDNSSAQGQVQTPAPSATEFRQPGTAESAPSPAVQGDMPLPQ